MRRTFAARSAHSLCPCRRVRPSSALFEYGGGGEGETRRAARVWMPSQAVLGTAKRQKRSTDEPQASQRESSASSEGQGANFLSFRERRGHRLRLASHGDAQYIECNATGTLVESYNASAKIARPPSRPRVRHQPLRRDQALVFDVRVGVRHQLHHAALGAEVLDCSAPAGGCVQRSAYVGDLAKERRWRAARR